MSVYHYNGHVSKFDKDLGKMEVYTSASSKSEAINNIKFQIKNKLNMSPSNQISINEDKIELVKTNDNVYVQPKKKVVIEPKNSDIDGEQLKINF